MSDMDNDRNAALSRLRAMTDPRQQTWDLSENDVGAIRFALSEIERLGERLTAVASDLAALRAAVRALAGEWEHKACAMKIRRWPEAQAADEAERDMLDRCADDLRSLLLPGGDDANPSSKETT